MDVTKILAELRDEREAIEDAIRPSKHLAHLPLPPSNGGSPPPLAVQLTLRVPPCRAKAMTRIGNRHSAGAILNFSSSSADLPLHT
jgi:hypothetical protein